MTDEILPGFADPVAGAQACFRAMLDAMARPGSVREVSGVAAPAPLCNAAGAVLLTLADHATPVWLDPAVASVRGWLAFHTGASVDPTPEQTAFAVALSLPDLAALPSGTDEIPEAAATLILQVRSLSSGPCFSLSGPGLRQPVTLAVDGLPAGFVTAWARNHAQFPRGVDLILCAGNRLAALPRSVSVMAA